jgi:hypothetical protein
MNTSTHREKHLSPAVNSRLLAESYTQLHSFTSLFTCKFMFSRGLRTFYQNYRGCGLYLFILSLEGQPTEKSVEGLRPLRTLSNLRTLHRWTAYKFILFNSLRTPRAFRGHQYSAQLDSFEYVTHSWPKTPGVRGTPP